MGLIIGNPASLKSPTIKSVSNLCLKPIDENEKLVFDSAMREHKVSVKEAKKNQTEFDEPEICSMSLLDRTVLLEKTERK